MQSPARLLIDLLVAIHRCTPEETLAALYLMRAPRHLFALQLVAGRLIALLELHPSLLGYLPFIDADRRIETLRKIVKTPMPPELGALSRRGLNSVHAMKPHTGDSGIFDLLAINPRTPRQQADQSRFEELLLTSVLLIIRVQAKCREERQKESPELNPEEWHRAYLLRDDGSRLIDTPWGNRVEEFALEMRGYAQVDQEGPTSAMAELFRARTPEGLAEAEAILRAAQSALDDGIELGELSGAEVQSEDQAFKKYAANLISNAQVRGSVHAKIRPSVDLVGRILRILEAGDSGFKLRRAGDHPPGGNPDGGGGGGGVSPKVSIYVPGMTLTPVDAGGIHEGEVKNYYKDTNAKHTDREKEEDEEGRHRDPDQDGRTEPDISVYLGSAADVTLGHFAALNAMHYVERTNALLAWGRARLSSVAVTKVIDAIECGDPADAGPRFFLGLTLLTGRSLEQVATVRFCTGDGLERPTPTEPIWVSSDLGVLYVYAAEPQLAEPMDLPKLCWGRRQVLRIPLPSNWTPLLDAVTSGPSIPNDRAIRRAKKILEEITGVPRITAHHLSHTLKFALLEKAQGDLGIVKLVTDASDANLDNIIHYASYPVRHAQQQWQSSIRTLMPSYEEPAFDVDSEMRAGSAQPLNPEKVRAQIMATRLRIAEALAEGDTFVAFNRMTWFLARWLNLACAGRKTRRPVPAVILDDGTAWGMDKHRADASTDRIVFFGANLLQQLAIYFQLAESLAPQFPGLLDAIRGDDRCAVNLVYLDKSGEIRPFLPKTANYIDDECRLPENYARKLIRSEALSLPGRFIDAWLGHWVAGRHPYALISTMAMPEFRRQCLAVQAQLEQELGFELVAPEGMKLPKPNWPCSLPRTAKPAEAEPPLASEPFTDEQVEAWIYEAAPALASAMSGGAGFTANDAIRLVDEVVRRLFEQDDPKAPDKVGRVCDLIRQRTGVPLFGAKPKARLAKTWIANRDGMASLAYFQRHVMEAFERDLAALPDVHDDPLDSTLELGRLMMLLGWRGGIAQSSHLDAVIEFLGSDRPILGLDALRYLEVRVRCERTRETMSRTVFLEPYLATYASVERDRIREIWAQRLRGQSPQRRRARYEQALAAYLRSLGVAETASLGQLTQAVRHYILLNGMPVLAAYASGEIFTEDLGDGDLRRLHGVEPTRQGLTVPEPETKLSADEEADPLPLAADRKGAVVERGDCIAAAKSASRSEWAQRIREIPPSEGLPELLRLYALWMLRQTDAQEDDDELIARRRTEICRNVDIVCMAFAGYVVVRGSRVTIDELTIATLYEASCQHRGQRISNAAWTSFVAYLNDEDADKGGVSVHPISLEFGGSVSRKMLAPAEIDQILILLGSAISGISHPGDRERAWKLVLLLIGVGARRTEIKNARSSDVLGNLVRLEPHDDETFKTASAIRNLCFAAIEDNARDLILESVKEKHQHLIDVIGRAPTSFDRWFDLINKVVKSVTGDPSLSLHHLRHTFACRWFLSLANRVFDLKPLYENFPWLEGSLIAEERLDALLGREGPASHGLQAVSDFLGHLHGTTTLHHYIHVCCICLFALMSQQPVPDLRRAFRDRVASASTVNRARRRMIGARRGRS